jgi:pyruvate formate lyase activating enzyme
VTPGVFRGWLKSSLIEYPGRVCTVLFTGGCGFRCPFCFNPELVLRPETLPPHPAKEVLSWLESRRHLVSALFVTGGEPTLHPWLADFLLEVKARGLAVGMATNGGEPEPLLEERLLDYVAMDVKTVLDPAPYAAASGTGDPAVCARVRRSVELIMGSRVGYELRCTAVPSMHSTQTLVALAKQLRGARRLVFQQFLPGLTLDSALGSQPAFSMRDLLAAREEAAGFVGECFVRAPGQAVPAPILGTETRGTVTREATTNSTRLPGGRDGVRTS